ncbi:hypothetical protein HWV62_28880 [Athelia sp. TMB]|nr:hypothetical protein HWV62_28880 [Athelia sp. TMB]
MSMKPPFPCLSSPQTPLPDGTTCTLEAIRISRTTTIPSDFPYALEYDASGPHIPYLYFSGQGQPCSTIGNVGNIYHDFIADISPSPAVYARTDSGWTPWAGPARDGLVHHPYVPEFVLWTTPTKSLHWPYKWRQLAKIDSARKSQRALAEKMATKEGAEMAKLRAAADTRGFKLVPKSEIELMTYCGAEALLPMVSWSGAPLTTETERKRITFVTQVQAIQAMMESLKIALSKANAAVVEKSSELCALEMTHNRFLETHEKLGMELTTLRTEYATMNDANKSLRVQLSAAQDAFLQGHINTLEKEKRELHANLSSIAEMLAKRTDRVTELLTELEKLKQETQRLNAAHKVVLEFKEQEILALKALTHNVSDLRDENLATLWKENNDSNGKMSRLSSVSETRAREPSCVRRELMEKEVEMARSLHLHQGLIQGSDEMSIQPPTRAHNILPSFVNQTLSSTSTSSNPIRLPTQMPTMLSSPKLQPSQHMSRAISTTPAPSLAKQLPERRRPPVSLQWLSTADNVSLSTPPPTPTLNTAIASTLPPPICIPTLPNLPVSSSLVHFLFFVELTGHGDWQGLSSVTSRPSMVSEMRRVQRTSSSSLTSTSRPIHSVSTPALPTSSATSALQIGPTLIQDRSRTVHPLPPKPFVPAAPDALTSATVTTHAQALQPVPEPKLSTQKMYHREQKRKRRKLNRQRAAQERATQASISSVVPDTISLTGSASTWTSELDKDRTRSKSTNAAADPDSDSFASQSQLVRLDLAPTSECVSHACVASVAISETVPPMSRIVKKESVEAEILTLKRKREVINPTISSGEEASGAKRQQIERDRKAATEVDGPGDETFGTDTGSFGLPTSALHAPEESQRDKQSQIELLRSSDNPMDVDDVARKSKIIDQPTEFSLNSLPTPANIILGIKNESVEAPIPTSPMQSRLTRQHIRPWFIKSKVAAEKVACVLCQDSKAIPPVKIVVHHTLAVAHFEEAHAPMVPKLLAMSPAELAGIQRKVEDRRNRKKGKVQPCS